MSLHSVTLPEESAQDAAVTWFARWRSGQMTKAQIEAMETWLRSAPENAQALEEIAAVWDEVEGARRDPGIMAQREKAVIMAKRGLGLTIFRRAAAVALILGAGLATSYLYHSESGPTEYATRVGEQSTINLIDGSKVTLDTDSQLRVSQITGQRRVELVRGRAYFQVAKDPRHPFIVKTGRGSVTALGTSFDVSNDGAAMKVVLVEGRVRIKPAETRDKPVEMTAGHEFVGDRNGWRLTQTDARMETSWLTGSLVFRDEPLGDIVKLLSRYGGDKITIDDPAVARQRLSAVLKSGDTAAFLRSVELLNVASVQRIGPHEIRLIAQN